MTKPIALFILDGWGMRDMEEGNAVQLAHTPNYDRWMANYERAVLDASGEAVGLPQGQMGNSEVGHLNLGAGRVVYQEITRIDKAIKDDELAKNEVLSAALDKVQNSDGKLHLIGLLGPGGVHSHSRHLYALLDIADEHEIDPIVHVITDGRDTPPESAADFIQDLEAYVADNPGTLASVSGRYYAMDRDTRWPRTAKAYRAIAQHEAEAEFDSASEAIAAAHDNGVTDEFIVPVTLKTERDTTIQPGDCVLFYNFRADRMRQIVEVFVNEDFDGFERDFIDNLDILTMTNYSDKLDTQVLFPEQRITMTLPETLARAGLTQMHAAETEKYPHVTYFFNGGDETQVEGETRIMANSPQVATYDLQPEMSAPELTEKVLDHIKTEQPDFVLVNFANPDMVGHTGVLEAAVQAVEAVDECAHKLVEEVLGQGGIALITADHGNCERMIELLTGRAHTYHTTNPVNFIAVGTEYILLRPRGILADVAPTVLALLGVEQPAEMTGQSLVVRA